jgi:hypothetical protein
VRHHDRAARIRRIARLLVALGEPSDAAIRAAARLAPRVTNGPRGEQLAIIEHRERVAGGGDRGHEAWVLRRVLGWGERDAARALDCSRTALRLHLDARPPLEAAEEARRIMEMRACMDEVRVDGGAGRDRGTVRHRRLVQVLVVAASMITALAIATRFLP